jgi:hypothetical protein
MPPDPFNGAASFAPVNTEQEVIGAGLAAIAGLLVSSIEQIKEAIARGSRPSSSVARLRLARSRLY